MATTGYQAPKFRSIILGIILSVILLVLICSLSQAVKYTGAALMALPANLGLLRQVKSQEVQTIFLKNSPTLILVDNPGRYLVFTDDYDLLTMTMQLAESKSPAWLKISNQVSGEKVGVEFIHRGLRAYDTPLAKGRPIFGFSVAGPGRYEITHPERSAAVFVVPDYTTGKERAITLWALAQLGVAGLILGVFYARQRAKRMKAIREIKELANRRRGKDFWQSQTEKHQEKEK